MLYFCIVNGCLLFEQRYQMLILNIIWLCRLWCIYYTWNFY